MKLPRSLAVLMPLPSGGMLHQQVHTFLANLRHSYADMGVPYTEIILPGLDQAQGRAEILAFWEAMPQYEDALWLDSDMIGAVELVHDLGRLEEELLVCPYEQRKRDDDAPIGIGNLRTWALDTAGIQSNVEVREGRRMLQVRGSGLGFVRLRRSVLSKLRAAEGPGDWQGEEVFAREWGSCVPGMKGLRVRGYFECLTHEHPDGSGQQRRRPEDMSFFLRCKQAGLKAYALCDVALWHAGKGGTSLWDALVGAEREKARLRKRVDFELLDCPDNLLGLAEVLDGAYAVFGLKLAPGEVVLDLGANVGAFAVWAAKEYPGVKIHCYEPEPQNYARLVRNLWHAGLTGADAHRKAVVGGDEPDVTLYAGSYNDGEFSIHPTAEHRRDGAQVVPAVSAKSLPPCSVLKIDTEGAEREILESYPHLDDCKAVMLEWHSPEDYVWMMRFMLSRGFIPMVDRARGKPAPDRELCFVHKSVFPAERPNGKNEERAQPAAAAEASP